MKLSEEEIKNFSDLYCGSCKRLKSFCIEEETGKFNKVCLCPKTRPNFKKDKNFVPEFNRRYYNYKAGAEIRNLVFKLSKQQFHELTSQVCYYCSSFPEGKLHCGIDRVDNDVGYIYSNCVPCCIGCNKRKGSLSIKEFYNECKMFYEKLAEMLHKPKFGKLKDLDNKLTFDDVSLVPVHTSIKSRKEPDISSIFGKTKYKIPIFASCMNTVCETEMSNALGKLGAGSIIHRYMSIDSQVKIVKKCSFPEFVWFAIGASGDFLERVASLYSVGIRQFCVDVANGHSEICINAVQEIKKRYSGVSIMAGCVATGEGALDLIDAGATIIRANIGAGAACKTRVVTGFGVPVLSCLEDICVTVYDKRKYTRDKIQILSDGGCRASGDIVKCMAIGASGVIVGSLFAGTDESPGEILKNREGRYKRYLGMASVEGRQFNGWFSEENSEYVPEGEELRIPYKGPVSKILENLVGGIKVGMSYANARTLQELRKNAKFVRITQNGFQEGLPRI